MPRFFVGLSATFHDAAIAIVDEDCRPLFAESVERPLQYKRAHACPPDDLVRGPELVEGYCGRDADLTLAVTWGAAHLSWLGLVAGTRPHPVDPGPRDPLVGPLPTGWQMALALRNSISGAGLGIASSPRLHGRVRFRYYEHHLTHAANAALTSGFNECVVAVADGFGEGGATAFYRFEKGRLRRLDRGSGARPGRSGLPERGSRVPDPRADESPLTSPGFFYGRLCDLCGFDPILGEEGKVMGLAAHGAPDPWLGARLEPLIRVDGLALAPGCSIAEARRHLSEIETWGRERGHAHLEMAPLAATGQRVFEELLGQLLQNLYDLGLSENLAFAGGCALNSSFNGRISERTGFRNLHVPCAPADDGNALGAAFLACKEAGGRIPTHEVMSPYLGSPLEPGVLERVGRLGALSAMELADGPLAERVAGLLADGKIVGWARGRAEFGPRALGNRSILADPRRPEMADRLNARVKFREPFRPFAPAILHERGHEYFESYRPAPYMERTLRFKSGVRDRVPSVVHADGTGRLQSIRADWNPGFHRLVMEFERRTGVPVLLNTSFNVMGKPLAHSVADALGTFFTTGLDALVLENLLIEKNPQGVPPGEAR